LKTHKKKIIVKEKLSSMKVNELGRGGGGERERSDDNIQDEYLDLSAFAHPPTSQI
jgi:hypothetical protein